MPASAAELREIDTLYVVRRGWHIDLGFAVKDMQPTLRRVADHFPGARYLLFGFGDRRYLTTKGWHVPAMLTALWPGRGLILTTALRGTPEEAFGPANISRLVVSEAQYREVQEYVWRSLGEITGASPEDRLSIVAEGSLCGQRVSCLIRSIFGI